MRKTTLAWIAVLLAALGSLPSFAQALAFPNRPVTLVVPVAPGGILDTVARMLAADMGKHLGQSVVVDNKPGASGNIGASLVAKSPPDGYTMLVGYSMFHVGNPSMFKNLFWGPLRDFASVAMVAVAPHVVAVLRRCRRRLFRSWLLDLIAGALAKDPQLAGFKGFVSDSGEGR